MSRRSVIILWRTTAIEWDEAIKKTGEDERSSPVVKKMGVNFTKSVLVAKVPRLAERH